MSLYSEFSRKSAHVIIVTAVALMNVVMTPLQTALIVLMGFGVFWYLHTHRLITHITNSPRKSFGPGLLFVGLLLLLITHTHFSDNTAFYFALFMLGFADVVAMSGGYMLSKFSIETTGKTWLGTLIFGLCGAVYLWIAGIPIISLFIITMILSLVEYLSIWGSDNVTIPLASYFCVCLPIFLV